MSQFSPESRHAWVRLWCSMALAALGSAGMWVIPTVLPSIQSEFSVARGEASLPYLLSMIGYGLGGVATGRLADRFGVSVPLVLGALALAAGFVLASASNNLWQFSLIHALLISTIGCSACFAPLMSDISLWFDKRRGLAVALCASGNYVGGAIWPPLTQYWTEVYGWRSAYWIIASVCLTTMLPLAWVLRHRAPLTARAAQPSASSASIGMSPGRLQALLCVAGLSCCIAMAMPQVHIVAYCADLGYGPARGAQMLSLMLACGVISRLASGYIADRIGGIKTLLLGSCLQCLALALFIPFDGLGALYMASILFGLFQGGIVPSYPLVVRHFFPGSQAGQRTALIIFATLVGMAIGGWASGWIFDRTGSYRAAFVHGVAWNLLNVALVSLLLRRSSLSLART